jgi:hypothetical protein
VQPVVFEELGSLSGMAPDFLDLPSDLDGYSPCPPQIQADVEARTIPAYSAHLGGVPDGIARRVRRACFLRPFTHQHLTSAVPLLKLGIGEHWVSNAHNGPILNVGFLGYLGFPRTGGRFLRYYLWFQIIAGWILTSLWVGGLTGLVKM